MGQGQFQDHNGGGMGAFRVQSDPLSWAPATRVYTSLDAQQMARLDAYCRVAHRSRASALRQLTMVALRHFEEELNGR